MGLRENFIITEMVMPSLTSACMPAETGPDQSPGDSSGSTSKCLGHEALSHGHRQEKCASLRHWGLEDIFLSSDPHWSLFLIHEIGKI